MVLSERTFIKRDKAKAAFPIDRTGKNPRPSKDIPCHKETERQEETRNCRSACLRIPRIKQWVLNNHFPDLHTPNVLSFSSKSSKATSSPIGSRMVIKPAGGRSCR